MAGIPLRLAFVELVTAVQERYLYLRSENARPWDLCKWPEDFVSSKTSLPTIDIYANESEPSPVLTQKHYHGLLTFLPRVSWST